MLDIVGNIHLSLNDLRCLYVVGQDIHLINCVASPHFIKYIPNSERAQFHVVLKISSSRFPSILFDSDTQIFISGHLATPTLNSLTRINVPLDAWIAHKGNLDVSVEREVQKALVSGSVYVAKVCWNRSNQWNSYVKVVDCNLGKKFDIQLYPRDPTTLRRIQKLERGTWIHIQGCSAQGLPQEAGIFKVKIDVVVALGRSESTSYALRNNPKKRFNLTVDDWKPEGKEKKAGKKLDPRRFYTQSMLYKKSPRSPWCQPTPTTPF